MRRHSLLDYILAERFRLFWLLIRILAELLCVIHVVIDIDIQNRLR